MNPDSSSGSSVRRLRQRLRESTAQEILTAAEQIFVERGIYDTHMADIAARAGVAVGTLYNHYKDRDSLVNALIEERRAKLLQGMDDALVQTDGQPFHLQLHEILKNIHAHFEEHWQFFVTFTQIECVPPNMTGSSKAIQREIYLRFEQLIERGRKQGALRPKVVKLAPALLMGITRSMLTRRVYLPEEGSSLQHVDLLVEFFLLGAGVKKP
jgi:AcrR family transcriptional regulator